MLLSDIAFDIKKPIIPWTFSNGFIRYNDELKNSKRRLNRFTFEKWKKLLEIRNLKNELGA